jgi:hypothetical protein
MEIFKKYWFVLVIIVVVIALYVAVKKGVLNLFGSGPNEGEKMAAELENLGYNMNNLTITQGDAILISQQLLSAMNQFGTDEKTIIGSLSKLNKDDLTLVIKTFGVKSYDGQHLPSDPLAKYLYSSDLNLQGWLKAELGGKDLEQVKAIFYKNNIPF